MKTLGKSILIVLTLGIFLTSIISQSTNTEQSNQAIQETISNMEDDIDAGLIIQDGNLEEGNIETTPKSNITITSATGKVGKWISGIITKILQFIAGLFGKLVS